MDQNTTLILIMLIVNIVTNLCTTTLQTLQLFIKLIRKSECCGSKIEFKNNETFDKEKEKEDPKKLMDIIIDRLSTKMTEEIKLDEDKK